MFRIKEIKITKAAKCRAPEDCGLAKAPTGIQGLDEITGGGLPRGRPTLVCGSAGCGKTLLAMEFLVRGATQFDEPGVFMSFEETAVITGESGEETLTRHSLEEYVSDCVILLDHRVTDQMSTRRLRIVKYRGTTHETNEYPFLIDEDGISVMPVTSLGLQHTASTERISSGIPRLDAMLGGEGFFRGSTVLMSGTAGSGKSSIAAHFANAACQRGERCLYFAFEELPGQILRNMRSIGIDLEPWMKQDLLQFHASRGAIHGLEMHLATIHKLVREFQPRVVVMDPIGSLIAVGTPRDASVMLTRLTDQGVELQNVYLGAEGVLTGSARQTREATEKAGSLLRHQEVEAKQRERVLKREAQEARIIALQKKFEAEEEVAKRDIDQEKSREETHRQDRDRSNRPHAAPATGDR